jgi:N-acetylmuramoyl-L-alanine amidase
MDEKETEKLSLSKLVIVIDPGHGVSLGNVGTQARKYKYKQQSDDGKEKKDKSGNVLTSISNVETIPQYVIDDPTKWVVGTIEDQKLDSDRTESFYVYDISQIMKELLKSKGYTIIITRTIRNVVSGYTIKTAISFRNDIANNNKADYFISLHYDGATNFNDCGSHAIYNSKNITDKVFADTILKYYTVVEKMSKHPNARTDLGVLETGNKTKYKTLIELGFISSLKDAKAMYANKNLIAQQIIQGLEEHIDRYFEL